MNILILGARGQVGWALQRSLAPIGLLKACDRNKANLEDFDSLRALVRKACPDVIVNAAAYTAVDKAEEEPDKAKRINADAVALLAHEANRIGALLIHYSTDYVFDGRKNTPYTESDYASPINVYGHTKWRGEEAIRESSCKYFIFRTSWVYATRGHNFIKTMLRLGASRDEISVVADQYGTPTHADLIADVTAHVLFHIRNMDDEMRLHLYGTYHLSASGKTSWYDYARYIFELVDQAGLALKVKPNDVKPISSSAYLLPAERPKNSCINCEKLEHVFQLRLPVWRQQVRMATEELINAGERE